MHGFFQSIAKRIINDAGVDIDTSTYSSEFDLFEAMISAGVDQSDIIKRFSSSINLPFVDVMQYELEVSSIYPDKMDAATKHIRIFPFVDNEQELCVAVSENSQMDYVDDLVINKQYRFVFCFQFLIDMKLKEYNGEDSGIEEMGLAVNEMGLATLDDGDKTLLLASGVSEIDTLISNSNMFKKYRAVDIVEHRDFLSESCENNAPDILLLGDSIGGRTPITEIMLNLKTNFPDMRIVYLAGELDPKDRTRQLTLGTLASAGIYDIITKSELSIRLLLDILDNPCSRKNVEHLIRGLKDSERQQKSSVKLFVPEEEETEESANIYDNLFGIVSSKGGTGKTFILSNLAIAIANNGTQNLNGKKPTIGIIDLDFQGFGISKFFDTLDDKDNIFSALSEAAKIIDSIGERKDVPERTLKYVNERLRYMFVPSKKFPNIKVLGGTDVFYKKGDLSLLNPYHLTYIIETVIEEFDILLIDINTDIENTSVFPLYTFSNWIYYVLEMDWANFHNSKRFYSYLEEKKIYSPRQSKYLLNKAFQNEELYVSIRDIEAGIGFDFDGIIPMVDGIKMFNMSCKAENIITNPDESLSEIKYYFMKLANDMYPIREFDIMTNNFEGNATFKTKKKEPKKTEEKKDSNVDIKKTINKITDTFGVVSNLFKSKKSIESDDEDDFNDEF